MMLGSWESKKCIVCLETGNVTDEHVIPESIGGKLRVRFLCGRCNSSLGSYVDASAKGDPSVRLAVTHLKTRIPKLAASILASQIYTTKGPGPAVNATVKRGRLHVHDRKLTDGSVVQGTLRARRGVKTLLRRKGHPPEFIERALEKFDSAPENTRIELADEVAIIKWPIDKIEPLLAGDHMDALVPVKIAYEFLACHPYADIYGSAAPLERIRNDLRTCASQSPAWEVEYLHASYDTFHGIALAKVSPHVVLQIRLFGWLAFRVHFLQLALQGPQLAYTHRLDSGVEQWSRVA